MMRSKMTLVGWLGAAVLGGCNAIAGLGGDYVLGVSGEGGSGGSNVGGSGVGGVGGGGGAGGFTPIGNVEKLDLLLMIDNSRSMADKQHILGTTIPDLVEGFVNPRCIHPNGAQAAAQPAGPLDPCPTPGTTREFKPLVDIHIGIVSSSIGGHGADSCPDQENNTCSPNTNYSQNDKGHLVSRQSECGNVNVATYQNKGFLAWDPEQKLTPPGEGSLNNLTNTLHEMVLGTGQIGCGYESQLESWYRFLVDPEPYEKISVINSVATPEGTDEVLLTQRAEFLRPDSLLAIIMLTDENDCSTKEFGQFYFASQLKNGNGTPFHLPRPRAECATNPNDPCCRSCGMDQGSCPMDPTCFDANDNVKALTDVEDQSGVRCFDQKRRFGIDFLYPIDRYVQALTSKLVPNRAGELVPNPLFSDLDPLDDVSLTRDDGLVFLAGIVGVPWQDVARDPNDLTKGFKDSNELVAKDINGVNVWDILLGDPPNYVPPKDPHMIESISPRSGVNPVTGDAIVPPGQPPTSPINGSEWTIKNNDDLQYACIFPLLQSKDCGDVAVLSCDCKDPNNDNPLCEPDPGDPTKRTLQTKAKAYPGLRHLQVLKAIGVQGITASVCPAQLTSPDQADYGYRPAVASLMERARSRLKPVDE